MTEIQGIAKRLKKLGVDPAVVKLVRNGDKMPKAPGIDKHIVERLAHCVLQHGRAVLMLSKKGSYSVFSVDGINAIREAALRSKPWEFRGLKTQEA